MNDRYPPSTSKLLSSDQRCHLSAFFAENAEMLGGYVILYVADLDASSDWAARVRPTSRGGLRIPASFGSAGQNTTSQETASRAAGLIGDSAFRHFPMDDGNRD